MSDQQQQQQQQKGNQQQQKQSPGLAVALPIGLNDIDKPEPMARVSFFGFVIGAVCLLSTWIFPVFKKAAFPNPPTPAGPDLTDIKGMGKAMVDTGKGVPYGHEIFSNLAPDQQKALAEGLAKRAGLKIEQPQA